MGSQTGINLSHTKQDKTINGKMDVHFVDPNIESPNGNRGSIRDFGSMFVLALLKI